MSINISLVLLILIQCSEWVIPVKKEECGYKQCPLTKDGALNVHLIPHSHMDAGWVKTFDEYYYGTRQQISTANVQLIYHSVLSELLHDKNRKFTLSETAYFWRWWKEQRPATRAVFRKLVQEGRLEFAGGGWVQNDEATADYEAIIDCYTLGLRILNDTLGPCAKPKAAWQIDTYGHSREQTSLMAQMGFDGLFISRVSFKERETMIEEDRLEFMWRGSDALGKMSDIMTHTLFNLYNPPEGFCFDYLCNDEPIMEEPESKSYNADKRVAEFITQIERQAKYYNHDNIVVMMGGDFTYLSAAGWFMNMDKLINHVNNHPANMSDVNIFYSSPSCYLKAVYLYGRRDKAMYTEKGDHLPYGTDSSTYWTGYYTSRPSLKYLIRKGQQFLQILKQLSVITQSDDSYELHLLRHTVSLVHHHDAITGTSQQHVANDYLRSLTDALSSSMKKVSTLLSHLTPSWGGSRRQKSKHQFIVCHELNITQCNITENKDTMLLLLYNPSSLMTYHYVRLPAVAAGYIIKDYKDEEVEYQLVPISSAVMSLPGRKSSAQQELYFEAENIPPLGYSAFYITAVDDLMKANSISKMDTYTETDQERIPTISNEYIKLYLSKDTGMLQQIQHINGVKIQMSQNFYFYAQTQALLHSGAYSFRPGVTVATPVTEKAAYQTVKGVLVKEIRQRFSDWITQIIRLYRGQEFIEFEWIVGPVPIGTDLGKEVVTRFSTNITNVDFYTDSNGRQMMQRSCWTKAGSKEKRERKPLAGCYYPVTSRVCISSNDSQTQLCVLTDRAQGATGYNQGEIELMVHRRLLTDDEFGLDEPLNEEAHGVGLVVKGTHRIVFGHKDEQRNADAAMKWKYEPWAFLANGQKLNRRKWTNVRNKRFSSLHAHSLPPHVHILTLEPWKSGSVLLRLENTRIPNDTRAKDNGIVTVDLRKIFQKQRIITVREATLSANQWLDEARQMDWSTRYVYDGDTDDISVDENDFGANEAGYRADDIQNRDDIKQSKKKTSLINRKTQRNRRTKRSDDEIENSINFADSKGIDESTIDYDRQHKSIESIERTESKINPEALEKSRHDILKKFIYSVLSGITHFNNHFSNLYGDRRLELNDATLNGGANVSQVKTPKPAVESATKAVTDYQDYDDQVTKPILDMYYKSRRRPHPTPPPRETPREEEQRDPPSEDKDYDTDENKRILQYNIFSKQEVDSDSNEVDNGKFGRDSDDNSTESDLDEDELMTTEAVTKLHRLYEDTTLFSDGPRSEKSTSLDLDLLANEYKLDTLFSQDDNDFIPQKRSRRDLTGTYMPFFININTEGDMIKSLQETDDIKSKIKRKKGRVKAKKIEIIETPTEDPSNKKSKTEYQIVDIEKQKEVAFLVTDNKQKYQLNQIKVNETKHENSIEDDEKAAMAKERLEEARKLHNLQRSQNLTRKALNIQSKIFSFVTPSAQALAKKAKEEATTVKLPLLLLHNKSETVVLQNTLVKHTEKPSTTLVMDTKNTMYDSMEDRELEKDNIIAKLKTNEKNVNDIEVEYVKERKEDNKIIYVTERNGKELIPKYRRKDDNDNGYVRQQKITDLQSNQNRDTHIIEHVHTNEDILDNDILKDSQVKTQYRKIETKIKQPVEKNDSYNPIKHTEALKNRPSKFEITPDGMEHEEQNNKGSKNREVMSKNAIQNDDRSSYTENRKKNLLQKLGSEKSNLRKGKQEFRNIKRIDVDDDNVEPEPIAYSLNKNEDEYPQQEINDKKADESRNHNLKNRSIKRNNINENYAMEHDSPKDEQNKDEDDYSQQKIINKKDDNRRKQEPKIRNKRRKNNPDTYEHDSPPKHNTNKNNDEYPEYESNDHHNRNREFKTKSVKRRNNMEKNNNIEHESTIHTSNKNEDEYPQQDSVNKVGHSRNKKFKNKSIRRNNNEVNAFVHDSTKYSVNDNDDDYPQQEVIEVKKHRKTNHEVKTRNTKRRNNIDENIAIEHDSTNPKLNKIDDDYPQQETDEYKEHQKIIRNSKTKQKNSRQRNNIEENDVVTHNNEIPDDSSQYSPHENQPTEDYVNDDSTKRNSKKQINKTINNKQLQKSVVHISTRRTTSRKDDKYNRLDPFNEHTVNQNEDKTVIKVHKVYTTTTESPRTHKLIVFPVTNEDYDDEVTLTPAKRVKKIPDDFDDVDDPSLPTPKYRNDNKPKPNKSNRRIKPKKSVKNHDITEEPINVHTTVKYITAEQNDNEENSEYQSDVSTQGTKTMKKPKPSFEPHDKLKGFYDEEYLTHEEVQEEADTEVKYDVFKQTDKFLDPDAYRTSSERGYRKINAIDDYENVVTSGTRCAQHGKHISDNKRIKKVDMEQEGEFDDRKSRFKKLVKDKKRRRKFKTTTDVPTTPPVTIKHYFLDEDTVSNKEKMGANTEENEVSDLHTDENNVYPNGDSEGIDDELYRRKRSIDKGDSEAIEDEFNRRMRSIKTESSSEPDTSESSEHMITLRPTQIRTFVIWFDKQP